MAALVLAEHDNTALKPATLNAVAAAKEIAGPEVDILVAGQGLPRRGRGGGQDCRREKGAARRRCRLRPRARREFGTARRRARRGLHASAGAGDDLGQECDASGRGPPRRDADLGHQRGRLARYLRASDLCRQRARDGAVQRPGQGHHGARHRLSARRSDGRPRRRSSRCPRPPQPGSRNFSARNCRNRSVPS